MDGLIRDAGPEPVACVPPPNPPPTINSVYHKCTHNAIQTFDTPAILADNRHEHASIYAGAEAGTVEIYDLNRMSRSAMPSNNTPVWLSLGYDDAKQNGATDTTLHIKPETIMYGNRYPPESTSLPRVRVVP